MKLALVIVASLVGLILLIGFLLPEKHEVSRSLVLRASPADVYRIVADVANAPSWRRDVQRVELLPARDGRTQFREHASHGVVTYEIVENVPVQTLVTRIVDRDLGYSGSWTYSFVPHEAGTRLTITERGEVSNILFRFLSRFVFGHAKTIETYLGALSQRVK
jgi:uncharacterized protein YndB with AHSA1/START domain